MKPDQMKAIKEELEDTIEELKGDVDEKGHLISENKKLQEESFELMFNNIERLKEELKVLGKQKVFRDMNQFFYFSS